MQNFDHAIGATNSAINSSGIALKQNEAYMESIEAKITAVSAAFQQMSSKVVDSNLVKGILDIVKAFAELGSTNVGSAITQIVLLSGVSWGGLQLLGQSILPGIIGGFKAFASVLKGVTLEATAASLGFKSALSAGLAATLPVILGVTTAIVALVNIIKGIKSAYEEANPSVEQAYANMQEANESLSSTEKKYTEAKNKLEELNSTPFEDRTAEMQAEIDKLQSLVEYYEAVKEAREGKVDEATASYIKLVESEGFKQGINVSGVVKTGGVTKEGLAEVKEFTGLYKDLESAVIAAASAEAKFNGNIIDISDIQKASVELQRYGYIFDENTISTFQLQTSLNDFRFELLETKELTPSLISQYGKLISTGQKYAKALQEQKEKGAELTFEQRNFLATWDLVNATYNAYKNNIEEVTDSIRSQAFIEQAASALSTFAQNLLAASAAYQLFKDKMKATGDYDDSFKGLASVFSELNGEYEKGQVGSTAFLTALELLTGQSFTSAEAVDYMNTHLDTLQLLFGDSESGGMGLITALQDLGYATLDADGNLQVSIGDFSSLASELGISEGALYSLTQALKVMGINFKYSAEDILDNVSKLGEGIVENLGDKTIVNFEKFVEKAQEAGMSTDKISQIGDVLSNASNVNLTNVNEGLALLESSSGEASGSADDLTGSLKDIGGTSGGIDSTASSVSTLSDNLASASGSASSLYTSLSGISNLKFPSLFNLIRFNAEGTNYAEEGDSLVNEEGPELIQSRDKAYIAGGGLPTITHLHRGDKVYTAEETKDILKGEELSNPIQAHEKGTLKNGGSSKKITINGGTTSIAASLLAGLKGQSRGTTRGSSSSSSSSLPQSSSQGSSKDEFDEWLKAKKHALAMDEITEEQYYTELEKMNEKYFKNSKEYQDEYWKYQEEVYKWRKSQLDDENKLLEKQIDLEKALSELAKAKEQKILVYKDGRFQYIQDIDAIDEAQRNVAKLKSEAGYASGTTNASAGIHLVGENGPELRVLNSGDGIIPADATKNLLSLAQMNGVKLGDGLNKAMQILYSFDISNLSLPNVRNATEFFEGLKNYAYQYSYAQ